MKKSLVALAVLAGFAGAAAAQSSVTLFGVIDVAARYTKA
ncbi:porin, partial [Roseateles sp.]